MNEEDVATAVEALRNTGRHHEANHLEAKAREYFRMSTLSNGHAAALADYVRLLLAEAAAA